MYRVIEFFTDLQDGGHAYNVGDNFPRQGVTVSDKRLQELSGVENKRGKALIEPVKKETTKPEEPAAKPKKKKSKE